MKTAIVTGGSRGIGRAICLELAKNGYNVVLNYHNSEESARKIASLQDNISIFKADVSKREEVDAMIDFTLENFGKIDLVVNNAGIAEDKLFTDITSNEWTKMLDINLTGVFNVTQSALSSMLCNHSGQIVNISSIWGLVGASCEVAYSTTKGAIIAFTKALAKEVGPSNICVNAIAPGVIATDMTACYSDVEIDVLKENTPLGKIGTAEDIAQAVLFLANSKFITGEVINISGGFVI